MWWWCSMSSEHGRLSLGVDTPTPLNNVTQLVPKRIWPFYWRVKLVEDSYLKGRDTLNSLLIPSTCHKWRHSCDIKIFLYMETPFLDNPNSLITHSEECYIWSLNFMILDNPTWSWHNGDDKIFHSKAICMRWKNILFYIAFMIE
jgi:hypothetical protein